MPSAPPERIEDPPIVLRRYRDGELQALFAAVSTSTDHLSPWLAWASLEPLEQGLGDFIPHSIEAFDRGDNYDYTIWNLTETTLVGGAGLHHRLDGRGSPSPAPVSRAPTSQLKRILAPR
jgi:hypothetical protein